MIKKFIEKMTMILAFFCSDFFKWTTCNFQYDEIKLAIGRDYFYDQPL